jgi:4-hydroxybenzoate polyprenyltransferase
MESLSSMLKPEVLFIFIRGLLFLFAMCIPFDIRDMGFDKLKGVITLPVRFGAKSSVHIAVILLIVFMLLVILDAFYFNLNIRAASALLLSGLVAILLLQFAKTKQASLVFPLLYDSALLTQWIFILVFMVW